MVNFFIGLFEIFSSNSESDDGILDHETDVASLISRLHKPRVYYVNREMNAYEISPVFGTHDDANTMKRKWLKVPKGSIVKLMRVVSIDYEDTSSTLSKLKKIFCCNLITIKTDIAIEIKILENFDDFFKTNEIDSDKLMKAKKLNMRQTRARLSIADIRTKASFLPVYDGNEQNEEIDLIPISSYVKNQKIKKTSLQIARNFAFEEVGKFFIELKLFEENVFKPVKASLNNFNNSEMLQESQHLEIEKYMSIYDLISYSSKCSIIAAYSFTKKSMIFILEEPVDIGLKKYSAFLPLEDNLKEFDYFNINLKDKFLRAAQYQIQSFDKNINKIDIFAFKKKNFEGLRMAEIENFLVKKKHHRQKQETKIENITDSAIFTFDDKIKRNLSSSSSALFFKADKIKSSTFPKENRKQQVENEENENFDLKKLPSPQSLDKIESRFKRTSRAYSLPVDQAILIKQYMSSKIQESE